MHVKICGLSTDETMDAALDAGADFVGLVFFDKSPRNVSLTTARRLADRARGRARIVALLVDADDAAINDVIEQVAPDMLQLHGHEGPERVRDVRDRFGRAIMKVASIETPADAVAALAYRDSADLILFDAKAKSGAPLPGGNGVAFDWRALEAIRGKTDRWMLAGGLTADNVQAAIRLTKAPSVDVSSGVERAPGIKDIAKIRAFIAAAKTS